MVKEMSVKRALIIAFCSYFGHRNVIKLRRILFWRLHLSTSTVRLQAKTRPNLPAHTAGKMCFGPERYFQYLTKALSLDKSNKTAS